MSLPLLDNLVRVGQLKAEPRNDAEVRRMLAMARTRLADAQLASLSLEGRFTSSYNAAHATALAILRWHGYRSENRYIVFQYLEHTLGWTAARWRPWWPLPTRTPASCGRCWHRAQPIQAGSAPASTAPLTDHKCNSRRTSAPLRPSSRSKMMSQFGIISILEPVS